MIRARGGTGTAGKVSYDVPIISHNIIYIVINQEETTSGVGEGKNGIRGVTIGGSLPTS